VNRVAYFKAVSQLLQARALKFLSLLPANLLSHINGKTKTGAVSNVGAERNVWI
jgi:hypothetical protein